MPKKKAPFIRFMESYVVSDESGCWEWTGHKYRNGYGVIKVFGRDTSAHRLSYELHHGPIREGMHILHSCDNKSCVNPDHLRQGTPLENMKEAWERGLMNPIPKGTPNPRKGILNVSSKPVKVLGKLYGSLKEAERALSLGSGTVRFWINNCPHKAMEISREEYTRCSTNACSLAMSAPTRKLGEAKQASRLQT